MNPEAEAMCALIAVGTKLRATVGDTAGDIFTVTEITEKSFLGTSSNDPNGRILRLNKRSVFKYQIVTD